MEVGLAKGICADDRRRCWARQKMWHGVGSSIEYNVDFGPGHELLQAVAEGEQIALWGEIVCEKPHRHLYKARIELDFGGPNGLQERSVRTQVHHMDRKPGRPDPDMNWR